MKNKLYIVIAICCIVGGVFFGEKAEILAYITNGWVLTNPENVTYDISSSAGQYGGIITTYIETWESYCDEIVIRYNSSNENIYFYANPSYDNGTYAITYHTSDDHHSITFYKAFNDATSIYGEE